MTSPERVICVDLDGTLIQNDVSVDTTKLFVKKNIFNVFKLVYWLFKGIAYVKYRVAEIIEIAPSSLSYNKKLLNYLYYKKVEGAKIYLATGTTEKYAKQIAAYLKIFDGVFASSKEVNLVAQNKAKRLKQAFELGFDYAGNSADDVYIWKIANKKILVNPSKQALKKMKSIPYHLFH